ncbi:PQQ-binding-like beta-propeller repeat protein [Natrinema salinisoli]|uniref:outer membrane protein assembly factor BamB family protein n=1 Tax=Natrinema salinisoli TaxID=2878535 RepID=UPI001CEFBA0E|nr:PQQ-binding-like beta-propeller repeat protein [Natrinema salinisoli]
MTESGPQPTAQQIATECKMTRRRALQSVGLAAGATATGVTFGTDTATAAEGIVDGVVSAIPGVASGEGVAYMVAATNPVSMSVFVGLAAVDKLDAAINDAPSADQAILHNTATAEYENLTQHETLMNNRLTDAKSVASIEARHGLASTWEDGESSTTAYDRAMQRIRQYYEVPEFNHYHVFAKSLLQLGYVGDAAVETGNDAFVADVGTDGSGNNVQLRFRANPTEVSVTLHDGTAIENVNSDEADDVARSDGSAKLKVPQIHLQDTTNGTDLGTVPALDQSVVDSWDASNEEITFTADDGTQVTTDGVFVIPSVNDLNSARVLDYAEFFKILDEIHSQSDTVTGNYDQSFVDDVYAELDAGNLSPQSVRSPEGIARFLSGNEDQTSARFRLAMMQQFGMAQPDFSRIASMEATYTGFTEERVDPDPNLNSRVTYPSGLVEDKQVTGALFGNSPPAGGFQPEESYLVQPTVFYGDTSDNKLRARARDGSLKWDISPGDAVYGVGVHPSGDIVYCSVGSAVHAYDTTDPDNQLWSQGFVNTVRDIEVAPDGSAVVCPVDNGNDPSQFHYLDPETGESIWSDSRGTYSASVGTATDGSQVYFGDGSTLVAYDTEGNQLWENGPAAESIDASPTDDVIVVGTSGGSTQARDPSDGSLVNEYTGNGATVTGVACTENYVYTADEGPQVTKIDRSDWSQVWTMTPPAEFTGDIEAVTGDDRVFFSGYNNQFVLDAEDGSTIWQTAIDFNEGVATLNPEEQVSGVVGPAMLFDETTDPPSELQLSEGVITVGEMLDRDGNTVTHVTDQTISDLEGLSATPDSIDTIVDEIDQFDSKSDIKYQKHVLDILEHYDAEDQEDQVSTDEPDYQDPKYDSYNSTEYAEYMEQSLATYEEMLAEEEESSSTSDSDSDEPLFGGLFSSQNGGQLAGLAIVALIVMGIVSAAINKIPLVGK